MYMYCYKHNDEVKKWHNSAQNKLTSKQARKFLFSSVSIQQTWISTHVIVTPAPAQTETVSPQMKVGFLYKKTPKSYSKDYFVWPSEMLFGLLALVIIQVCQVGTFVRILAKMITIKFENAIKNVTELSEQKLFKLYIVIMIDNNINIFYRIVCIYLYLYAWNVPKSSFIA